MKQGFVKEQISGEIRLNKYLSDAGLCSRREADRLIEAGVVTVDGETAQQGMKIRSGQKIVVRGKEVEREKEMILFAVHKPRGVVCTTDKRWDDRTIYDVLDYPKRVFSIGRLDKESEGLLLMTNNGDILNKIMRAGNYHEKEYLVTVDRKITPEFLKKMAEGVYLRELEVKTRPCRIEMAGEKQFRIILTQGLNRQIRRMCEACHYKVTRLVRMRIMNIELGTLKPGEYRTITRKEWAVLQESLKHSKNPGGSAGKPEAENSNNLSRRKTTKNLEGSYGKGKTVHTDRSKQERNRRSR
jgi:23S rRNA pseudouridine2604 synthase